MKTTLTPTKLNPDHPALTKKGKWTAKASRLLQRKTIPTRVRSEDFTPFAHTPECANLAQSENPIRNTRLFYRIADMIETFPEIYNQGLWGEVGVSEAPCGTAFCIAGNAAHETGWNPWTNSGDLDWSWISRPKQELLVHVREAARKELGLTVAESNYLFYGDWKPANDLTVAQALRKIGDGEKISSVSRNEYEFSYLTSLLQEEKTRKVRVTGKKD